MEIGTETPTEAQINGFFLPDGDDLRAELESLRQSYHSLLSKSVAMEEGLDLLRRRNEEAEERNAGLAKDVGELSEERDSLRRKVSGFGVLLEEKEEEFAKRIGKVVKEKEELENEVGSCRGKIEQLESERASLCNEINVVEVVLKEKGFEFEEKINEIMSERDGLKNEVKVSREKIEKLEDLMKERDSLREKINGFDVLLEEKEVEFVKKMEELRSEVEVSREKIEKLEIEKEKKTGSLLKYSKLIPSVKECLMTVIESVDGENVNDSAEQSERRSVGLELEEELRVVSEEIEAVTRLASEAGMKVNEYKEARKKEKRELENSVVSLTEENRDINSLLRIALVEKEAVEKSLNRLKGNTEQKRVPLLQRVGFGFMIGSGTSEQTVDSLGASAGSKSDSSECEEEVVSLASTVEKIMKNLRLEITQLRRSLEESRSDTERLESLTEKQARQIAENTLYIRELEDRERVLAQNVEELLMDIKETEAEVARWREACELEVEAGKNEIEEREKVVAILKRELDKAKSALEISSGKLKLKEELAAAAMAAQAAAERSLQLADSRARGLNERIEELMRQLEEAERRERNMRRVRHVCWPWRTFKMNPANNTNNRLQNTRRMLPEMQSLLPNSV